MSNEPHLDSAYLDGQLACRQLQPLTDNPHKRGTPECRNWVDGWASFRDLVEERDKLREKVSRLEHMLAIRQTTIGSLTESLVDAMHRAERQEERAEFAEQAVRDAMIEGLRQCDGLRDADAFATAYVAGIDAHDDGESDTSNPFRRDEPLHAAWGMGWVHCFTHLCELECVKGEMEGYVMQAMEAGLRECDWLRARVARLMEMKGVLPVADPQPPITLQDELRGIEIDHRMQQGKRIKELEREVDTLRDMVAAESREVANRDHAVAVLEKRLATAEERLEQVETFKSPNVVTYNDQELDDAERQAEAILLALADEKPIEDQESESYCRFQCRFCYMHGAAKDDIDHSDHCPWERAREYVRANNPRKAQDGG